MAWCSPTDTVGALARCIAANGREMSAAGRGTVGAYMKHVSVMQVCLICIAGSTGPTGSVDIGVVTAITPARRAIRGGRAAAGPARSCRRPLLTAARSRHTAASHGAGRRPDRPPAPRCARRPAESSAATTRPAASTATRSSLVRVAVVYERDRRRGDIEAVHDPDERPRSTPATPTTAATMIAQQSLAGRLQPNAVADELPDMAADSL